VLGEDDVEVAGERQVAAHEDAQAHDDGKPELLRMELRTPSAKLAPSIPWSSVITPKKFLPSFVTAYSSEVMRYAGTQAVLEGVHDVDVRIT